MPRTRSKRGSLATKLDFNDSGDELDGPYQHETTNGSSQPATCPFCSCGTTNAGDLPDCICSSCSALNAAETTELRDDFCHRDRPRFVFFWPKSIRTTSGIPAVKVPWLLHTFVLLLIITLLIAILICLKWILIDGFGNLAFLWLNFEDVISDYEPSLLLEKYWILGPVTVCLVALLMGCTCACLSWNITYYDSLKPGILPPTPLSPIKHRHQTRHMFHLGYILAIANGLAAFTLAWWWL
ncbi:uncharacterized protein [Amphiura filiformis]|uniref:uncharacterized protein n=1 Tax=Amphiura filiformis TaxID=82378 RepID=UPI003B21F811